MSAVKKPKINRIVSLDLMRGWFLVIIILDHLSYFPNGLVFISGDSRLYVTAAEGFFIISGLVLGIVRGAKLTERSFRYAAKLIWRRSFMLYLTSIIITILSIAIGWHFVGNDGVKSPLPPLDSNIFSLFWRIVTLQEFYGWADYLRLYAIFLALTPAALWLLRRGKWYIVLAISTLVWLLTPKPVNEFTQPFTWQFIFFIAFTLGFYSPQIKSWWNSLSAKTRRRTKTVIFTMFIITFIANVFAEFFAPALNDNLSTAINNFHPILAASFDKLALTPARVAMSLLWFIGFFMIFQRFEKQIKRYLGWLLIPFGTNSLYVYSIHAFVVMGAHPFRLLPHVKNPEHQNRLVGELCRVAERMVILDYPDIRSFNMLYSLLFRLKKRVEGNTRSYILFNRRQIATAFAAHGFG